MSKKKKPEPKNPKPNCYDCKWRGTVPGSAHSSCRHPSVAPALEDPLANILAIFAGIGRSAPIKLDALGVEGNEHGIKSGWFNWPWDFDPVWLQSCDGFEKKEEKKDV